MKANAAFRLSRIQAEGWKTAHRVLTSEREELGRREIEALNPYAIGAERARWMAGFMSALHQSGY